jgi:hypothetical protein
MSQKRKKTATNLGGDRLFTWHFHVSDGHLLIHVLLLTYRAGFD